MATNEFITIDQVMAAGLVQGVYASREFQELDKKRSQTTFLEAIGKQRSETIFSAFLKWFFENADFNKTSDSSPLLFLLRLLALTSVKQEEDEERGAGFLMDSNLRTKILINDIVISEISVETEVSTYSNSGDGRIDLVLILTLKSKSEDYIKRVRILLENKVDSEEGTDDNNEKVQCKKYHDHFDDKSKDCNQRIDINVYVFLSIEKPEEISSPYFIKITYQELLDNVLLLVMIHASYYPETSVRYLKEFIDTITTLNTGGSEYIAKDADTEELLKKFYLGNKGIIDAAVLAGSNNQEVRKAIKRSQKSHSRNLYELSYNNRTYSDLPESRVALGAIMMLKDEGKSIKEIEKALEGLGEIWISAEPEPSSKKAKNYEKNPLDFGNEGKRWVNTNHWDKDRYFPKLLKVLKGLGFTCELM